MIGWVVSWKCAVACLAGEESQQPTCPQDRHSRRWTQVPPTARQSSQPSVVLGDTSLSSATCVHSGMAPSWHHRPDDRRAIRRHSLCANTPRRECAHWHWPALSTCDTGVTGVGCEASPSGRKVRLVNVLVNVYKPLRDTCQGREEPMADTRKSTLVLVAELAGVSIASVSRVMNGLPASQR